jgi:phage FluMu protein Com
MLVNCINQECKTVFIIPNSVIDRAKPSAICPSCKTQNDIDPLIGICSNTSCGKKFRYYDFLFNGRDPVVSCPHCAHLNQVGIRLVVMINTEEEFKELLKTRQSRCGNESCRKVLQYQEIMLDLINPLVTCPHCKSVNRIKLKSFIPS